MKPLFAPSLMCMDFLNARQQLSTLDSHCQLLHADIMDGHYCRNLALSPLVLRRLRNASRLPIDAHLMLARPGDFLEDVAACADIISLHAETIVDDAFRTIQRVHALDRKVGIVLNPATPLSAIEFYAGRIDVLTIMTVDVGYAGQPFIPEMVDKVRQAQALKERRGLRYVIQTDGANNANTYRALYQAGTRCFVMGSSGLFGLDADLALACGQMKEDFCRATGLSAADLPPAGLPADEVLKMF
ncbi:MAG: D-allulose 6-phosphate 3-epimerase [Eubacteriales bacterium]|nr:D-allulose 6-phosphate 3-epimerase [Eubacteriales bacterium]